jgi:type VI secretion system protein ImpA
VALDIDALLEPVSADQPAGPDLSYDDKRLEIETAFESGFSDAGDRGSDVNWSDVVKLIADQCVATKDVWLGIYLARAGALSGKLEVVDQGSALLAGLFERFWDSVHPQLDEYGLQGRVGPCESLVRIAEFIGPLRRTVLIAHPRLGSYSGADFERFERNGDAESDYGMFRAAMQETDQADIVATIAQLDAIRENIRRVDGVFAAQAPGEGPNFQATYEALGQMRSSVARFGPEDAAEAPAAAGEQHGDSTPSGDAGRTGGRIDSRDDVVRAIDAIADYYRRREPASPVPLVLARAREWVSLDFLNVLEDIAPGSMDEARRVLVSQRGQEGWNTQE